MSETPDRNESNGWGTWSKHVLNELVRLNSQQEKLREEFVNLKVQIAMLKVKSGAWGVVGALATIGLSILVATYFRR